MKRLTLITLLALPASASLAQGPHEVLTAEKAFAKYAVDVSVKQAFLKYMDSTAVVFDAGQVMNAPSYWTKVPESKLALVWKPVFAAIAASGDLGFTTGPYEVRRHLNDTAAAAGQYSTVWKKNEQGDWKFLVDMGIQFSPSHLSTTHAAVFDALTPATEKEVNIKKLEEEFTAAYSAHGVVSYFNYLMEQSWFNIDRLPPCTNTMAIMQGLQKVPAGLQFQAVDYGIAKSKDLAWCYGHTIHNGKTENYLRIWAHTKDGWKILLQVLLWK